MNNNIVDIDVEIEEIEYVETVDNNSENFDEVLQLSEYNGNLDMVGGDMVIAKYDNVNIIEIDNRQKLSAKKLIDKITKFVCDFNDVSLTDEHKAYIKHVGELQLSNLTDLLSLTEINKNVINNIVERVNATQAEDYAIINSYNNLINQHIKLIKEVSILYKSIPSTMKKMRAEVMTNQELDDNLSNNNDEVITEDYGDTQFNNGKQFLKSILENKKKAVN